VTTVVQVSIDEENPQEKTYLSSAATVPKLEEEVLSLLSPAPGTPPDPSGKPRVYLVYDRKKRDEVINAGLIKTYFESEAHFEFFDDCAAQKFRLASKLTDTMGNRQTTV